MHATRAASPAIRGARSALVLAALFCGGGAALSAAPRLPSGPLVIGYATDRSLREDKVVRACRDGVNVVIWAFAHLEVDGTAESGGALRVRPTFDVAAVRATQRRIAAALPPRARVAHLVAFGGWNGPVTCAVFTCLRETP